MKTVIHFSVLFNLDLELCVVQEIEDAQRICRTIVDCFERASLPNLSDEKRRKLLHFVVVGGGPTGVEFAAELHDYVNEDLVKLYPKVKEVVKITLLEATDHILNMAFQLHILFVKEMNLLVKISYSMFEDLLTYCFIQTALCMFDKRITAFAEEKFQRDGINLKTGAMVVIVDEPLAKGVNLTVYSGQVPHINQQNTWDFGLACTLMVLQALGVCDYTIQELVDLCCTISFRKDHILKMRSMKFKWNGRTV
ncbi:hypothetical protein C2S51_007230 [Perilla frutescens var. frutescens]|nr:hypothetical protein C2S51_007230 [Perilla frutescens var. frutescens]